MNYIISDYVPKALRSAARTGLVGVTLVTTLGLLRLSIEKEGLTECIKSLWRRKKN
jgi:succinate dehydrogenase (ubiquinone) membrane anchor subunit